MIHWSFTSILFSFTSIFNILHIKIWTCTSHVSKNSIDKIHFRNNRQCLRAPWIIKIIRNETHWYLINILIVYGIWNSNFHSHILLKIQNDTLLKHIHIVLTTVQYLLTFDLIFQFHVFSWNLCGHPIVS